MPAELPRVLFVTAHAFNRSTGGGVTFSNLFHGWPKDALATVHCDHTPVTTDVCTRYFELTPAELRPWGPLAYLRRRALASGAGGGTGSGAPAGGSVLRRAKRLVLGDYSPETAVLSPELERWIAAFRPQVLYTILGTNGLMSLVEQIRRRFDLPLVVHFMDDWPAATYRGGLLSPWQRRRMWRQLRHLVGAAKVRMGISRAMCEAYEVTYGCRFVPFHNGIDVAGLSAIAGPVGSAATPASPAPTAIYSGSILPFAQLAALGDVCRAVADLRGNGRAIKLAIACPPHQAAAYQGELAIDPGITVAAGDADWDTYFRRLCAADVLLLPVNFDSASIDFIRYSMPTKVAEYLASGVPILVYGPRGVAQVDEALQFGWACVVERPDRAALAEGLEAVLSDGALRGQLVQAARRHAEAHFDLAGLRSRFRETLSATAQCEPTT